MKNYTPGFAKPLLITIVAILIISVGFYYFNKDTHIEVEAISDIQAAQLVQELPEVKQYYSLFKGENNTSLTTGGRAVTAFDGTEGNAFVIWVYEDIPTKGEEPGHAVTFARYKVYKNTKEIEKVQ
jgi:hypothetical protein